MAISDIELYSLFAQTGLGKLPLTGGPAGSLKSVIAQTIPG
jgi:hypothetical protein